MGNLASPKLLRPGHAETKELLGMALDSIGTLALRSICTIFAALLASLELSHDSQYKPNTEVKFICTLLR